MALTTINRPDNEKSIFGTGDDLEIYHDGSDSIIHQDGTGDLRIRSDNSLEFNTAGEENAIWCDANGAVKLYYDTAKKLETKAGGVQVTGNLMLDTDSDKAIFGASNDLQIYHDGNSYVTNTTATQLAVQSDDLKLRSYTDLENYIVCTHNGSVDLYHNGVKKLATGSGGVDVTGGLNVSGNLHCTADGGKLIAGAGDDLQIYHDATNTRNKIECHNGELRIDKGASSETLARFIPDGAVELFHNDVKKLETTSLGVSCPYYTGGDGAQLRLGDSGDLQIYHDGSNNNSYIKETNASGHLYINGTNLYLSNADNDKDYITCVDDGAVTLKYDNATKFATHSAGCMVTGNIYVADGNTFTAGGDNDLAFYHDAGSSKNVIDSASSNLEIRHNAEKMIACAADGQVELYYDNVKKFETSSIGTRTIGQSDFEVGTQFAFFDKTNTGVIVDFQYNSSQVGNIGIGTSSTTYNTSSDYRLKENVSAISDGITRVKQLKPSKFNWIVDDTNTPVDGFLAHEVSSLVPEAVSGEKDAVDSDGKIIKQCLDNSKLVPLLTAALKEAITKIETLETKVAALEAG